MSRPSKRVVKQHYRLGACEAQKNGITEFYKLNNISRKYWIDAQNGQKRAAEGLPCYMEKKF